MTASADRSRSRFLRREGFAALAVISLLSATAAGQPNVLLIISDDAGWADFGFNDQGNGQIPTPALDSIAARGRWFRSAYTASVCSPSRARIFLGQHGQRTGYDNNSPDSQNAGDAVVEGLRLDDTTMFERMNDAGYHVGYFGKWHLGTERDVVSGNTLVTPGNLPPRHGIDYFLGLTSGSRNYFTGQVTSYQQLLREQTLDPVTNIVQDVSVEATYPANTYMTDLLAEEVADYITDRHDAPEPFFATLSFTAPHGPLQAVQADFDFVDANIPGLTGNRRTYAAMMVAMNRGVQTVLDRLADPDGDGDSTDSIVDETLICFINDNGGETANSARNFPLRGKKSDTFDGGIRVMMCMAGPGIPATGASYDEIVDSADLVPTFLAAAGAPLGPADVTDGVNLLPYLDGSLSGKPHENIYVRGNNPIVAGLRRDAWKLTIENIGGPFLYDIVANLGETIVRNTDEPAIVDELVDLMHGYEAEYLKPRWGPTDVNPFDGFEYLTGVNGSWGDPGTWASIDGSVSPATMFGRDGYANLVVRFPVGPSSYTSTNDLRRPNQFAFMANRVECVGTYGGAVDADVLLDGLAVMFVDSLDGALPSVRMEADASGPGSYSFEIGFDLHVWDNLQFDGAGTQPMVVSGDIVEERPGASVTKSGAWPLRVRGDVSLTGMFDLAAGTTCLESGAHADPAVLRIGAGAMLELRSESSDPDLIGNFAVLEVVMPGAGLPSVNLAYEGVEVVGGVTIDGVALPLGTYGAASHPGLFSGSGQLVIRGPAMCDGDLNDDGFAEFFDTLSYLAAFDAAQGCGAPTGTLPGGITVNNEAWNDSAGDASWDIAPPGTDVSRVWSLGSNATPEPADAPSLGGLVSAYRFPDAAASGADYETPARSPSSIEIWFNADSLVGDQILWEAGGGARGGAIWLSGSQLRFDVQNGTPAPISATAIIGPGWHQVVGVVDIDSGISRLYIDGQLEDTQALGSMDRWAGGNPSGLGTVTSTAVGNITPSDFAGLIAIYRFYNNTALTDQDVADAYDFVANAGQACDPSVDLDQNGVLDASDVSQHLAEFDACP